METRTENIFFERISVFGNESFFSEYASGFRFGFNKGSEKDNEIYGTGNAYTTTFRELDVRLNRWWSIDPKPNAYQSPYISIGDNPLYHDDFFGDKVDGDTKGMQHYNAYRKEVNLRIADVKSAITKLDNSPHSKDFKTLRQQYVNVENQYKQINHELNALEADKKNLYFINTGVDLSKEDTPDRKDVGITYFSGKTTNMMNQINIDISQDIGTDMEAMNPVAHELKHAYQYYTGLLGFYGKKGFGNHKLLEQQAYQRGDLFNGSTMLYNHHFKYNLDAVDKSAEYNHNYYNPALMQYYEKQMGMPVLYNNPDAK